MRRSSSGISPVVATVILVAIAIVIAIAVAFWASGLVGVFTRFEKLEIRSSYAEAGADGYTVHLTVFNSGSSNATIDEIYINGRLASSYDGLGCDPAAVCDGNPSTGEAVGIGQSVDLEINLPAGAPFSPGVSIEVMVHSASGKQYPTTVLLP